MRHTPAQDDEHEVHARMGMTRMGRTPTSHHHPVT